MLGRKNSSIYKTLLTSQFVLKEQLNRWNTEEKSLIWRLLWRCSYFLYGIFFPLTSVKVYAFPPALNKLRGNFHLCFLITKSGLIQAQWKRSHKHFTTWRIKVQLLLWSSTCIKPIISLDISGVRSVFWGVFFSKITLSMDEMLILTKPSGQTCPRGWSKVRPKAVWCPTRGLLRSRGHKWFVKHGPTQRAKRGTWIRFMSDKYILISVFTVANVDGDASPISRWKFISAGAAERDSGHAAIALRWVVTRKCTVAAVVIEIETKRSKRKRHLRTY